MTAVVVSQVYDGAGHLLSEITRPETPADINAPLLLTRAQAALATNATFLAIANPTAAQSAAQVKALTRQCNGLFRLLLSQLSDVSDT